MHPQGQRYLTEADLSLIRAVHQPAADAQVLRERLLADRTFRTGLLSDDRLFEAVTARDEPLVPVSPRLFFEVLLHRATGDMARVGHTVERDGSSRVAVFDTSGVLALLRQPGVLEYLASMLASFTKVRSYTTRVRVRRGIIRRSRYSDLDIFSLQRSLQETEEPERMPLYQRAGDLCLLTVGIFPDFAATAIRYPATGALRPHDRTSPRLTTEEYEALAQQMYDLAAGHPASGAQGLSALFRTLSGHVLEAKKPLSFISEHYLRFRRQRLFDWEA